MEELIGCWYILVGLVGLCVGSFLNVVIYRVPHDMSLSHPASHCPTCGYELKWYDNIPLLSYLILRGKCRKCRGHISLRYPLVEFLNMVLWLTSFGIYYKTNIVVGVLTLPIISTLICIAFIDFDEHYIPDRFQIILLGCTVLICLFDHSASLLERGLGAAITLAFLALIWCLFYFFRKRESLGIGDIKLMTICGAMLGIWKVFLSLLLSSLVASIVLLCVMKKNKDERGREYAFAPFLVFGILVALLFGDPLIGFYMSLF